MSRTLWLWIFFYLSRHHFSELLINLRFIWHLPLKLIKRAELAFSLHNSKKEKISKSVRVQQQSIWPWSVLINISNNNRYLMESEFYIGSELATMTNMSCSNFTIRTFRLKWLVIITSSNDRLILDTFDQWQFVYFEIKMHFWNCVSILMLIDLPDDC